MGGQTLPFELTFEEHHNYLFATVKAPSIDRATALDYLGQVAAKCKELGVQRLMLVRNIPAMLPDGDLFFTTRDFLAMIGTLKVAFVNPYMSIQDQMRFAILIGTNRGANYDLFNNVRDAETWLLSEADSATFTAKKEQ